MPRYPKEDDPSLTQQGASTHNPVALPVARPASPLDVGVEIPCRSSSSRASSSQAADLAGLAELENILGPVDALQLDAIIQAAQALKEKCAPLKKHAALEKQQQHDVEGVSVGPICNANREFMYVLNMWTFLFHGAVGGCFMARICCRPRLRTRCRAVRVCDCEDSARSIDRSQVGKKTTGYG